MGDNVPVEEDPFWDPVPDQENQQLVQIKAKPAFVNIPVTLDPLYDPSSDEPYINQVFTWIEKIGEGAYGYVFKATHKSENKKYAIKKLKTEGSLEDEKYNEIKTLEQVGYHPHIVRYFMGWEEKDETYLLLQLSQISLADFVKNSREVPEYVYWDVIHDMCLALKYLSNERRLIHYDVKDRNILIHGKHFKLADFGVVLDVQERQNLEEIGDYNIEIVPMEDKENIPEQGDEQDYEMAEAEVQVQGGSKNE
ncbi:unnamed protein product [Diabrotica balteata]|uniref:non-specific serine/threonine protein kinase n=1 Tax=Diabrotica balteata TaxID=107213 RepID=A0A9N9SPN9_DIABA|nr:unnamed protein product [Diabrotica balteata]